MNIYICIKKRIPNIFVVVFHLVQDIVFAKNKSFFFLILTIFLYFSFFHFFFLNNFSKQCCNHPYLFDGAEVGPPYYDGPHLWENCGKMIMLDKLLPRLKKEGSRVLVFCQMTRMLDIMEDYCRFKRMKYCRIDGSTSGDRREDQMEEYNREGSDKFLFMLSTRAGGLGINLYTADVVILYDSDWNPQMDLQAMDRAHRIGQKKQVRVFRFVTEGSVEEKIVERAQRKLYLDAVVIQQGRLMQQNKNLSKEELATMVRFGADEIFKSKDATLGDADIDAILAHGEERTEQMNKMVTASMENNLQNFTLDGKAEQSLFEFEGTDFGKKKGSTFITLPKRERKKQTYDVNQYFKEQFGEEGSNGGSTAIKDPRKAKIPRMDDFQFFDRPRIEKIYELEYKWELERRQKSRALKERRKNEKKEQIVAERIGPLSAEDLEALKAEGDLLEIELNAFQPDEALKSEKQVLFDQGFNTWNRRDFKSFCLAMEKFGREDRDSLIQEVVAHLGKDENEVKRYFDTWMLRHSELSEDERHMNRIIKGEEKIQRRKDITNALDWKVNQYGKPWQELRLQFNTTKGKQL